MPRIEFTPPVLLPQGVTAKSVLNCAARGDHIDNEHSRALRNDYNVHTLHGAVAIATSLGLVDLATPLAALTERCKKLSRTQAVVLDLAVHDFQTVEFGSILQDMSAYAAKQQVSKAAFKLDPYAIRRRGHSPLPPMVATWVTCRRLTRLHEPSPLELLILRAYTMHGMAAAQKQICTTPKQVSGDRDLQLTEYGVRMFLSRCAAKLSTTCDALADTAVKQGWLVL